MAELCQKHVIDRLTGGSGHTRLIQEGVALEREEGLLLAFRAWVDLVALPATAVVTGGAAERVFMAMATTRVVCLVKTSAYGT